jgi:DNA-binding winged helix-turn-helix (wHTH) protein
MKRFGQFELDEGRRRLSREGVRVTLNGQTLDLLLLLLERPGELVTREEIRQRLWPQEHVNFDHGIDVLSSRLRKALSDSSATPEYIETVPKRGYRFVAIVVPAPMPSEQKPNRRWLWKLSVYAAVALVAAVASVVFAHTRYPDRAPAQIQPSLAPR